MAKGDIIQGKAYNYKDPVTGKTVTRLTAGPGHKSILYFHDRPITSDGRITYVSDQTGSLQLYQLSLSTMKTVQLTNTNTLGGLGCAVMGPGERNIYYADGKRVKCVNSLTLEERAIAESEYPINGGLSVNADETLVAIQGAILDETTRLDFYARTMQRNANYIKIIPTDGSENYILLYDDLWLTHAQFSPKYPQLLCFCHEGHMLRVSQRVWLADVKERKIWPFGIQPRDVAVSHEVWSRCGEFMIFQCVQNMREEPGLDPWNTGHHFVGIISLKDRTFTRYYMDKEKRNYGHYAPSNNPATLICDGETLPGMISVVRLHDGTAEFEPVCQHKVAEPLKKLKSHPHPSLAPDDSFIVFNSDMEGTGNIYRVNVSL